MNIEKKGTENEDKAHMKIEQEETVGLEDPPQFEEDMFSPMS